MRSYGADRIIDYTATPLPQAVAGQQFDVVLNLVRTSAEETAGLAAWPPTAEPSLAPLSPTSTTPGAGSNR